MTHVLAKYGWQLASIGKPLGFWRPTGTDNMKVQAELRCMDPDANRFCFTSAPSKRNRLPVGIKREAPGTANPSL